MYIPFIPANSWSLKKCYFVILTAISLHSKNHPDIFSFILIKNCRILYVFFFAKVYLIKFVIELMV